MRVLLLCNDYPPLNSIGAQRPYSWYLYWTKAGHEVDVVAKESNAGAAGPAEDMALEGGAPSLSSVYRVRHRRLLSERFRSRFGHRRLALIRRSLTFVEQAGGFVSSVFDRHSCILGAAFSLARERRFDVVIATGEPFVLFRHAWLISRTFSIPWVADFRDGWRLNHVRVRDRSLPSRALQGWEWLFERRYVGDADLVTTVDPWLSSSLEMLHHRPIEVIYNGFWRMAAKSPTPASGREPTVLVHAGTLTPGQRIEVLLDALKALKARGRIDARTFRLELLGLRRQPVQLERVMRAAGAVEDLLAPTEHLDRELAFERCCRADFLVALTEESYKAIFAKTYDYLAARRPILVIPDDRSILTDLVVRAKAGRAFDDAHALAAFLDGQVQERERTGRTPAMPPADDAVVRSYSRERQAMRFLELLQRLPAAARKERGVDVLPM